MTSLMRNTRVWLKLSNSMESPNTSLDLDKARDEKCVPVAREVMAAMAELMIPADANVEVNYNPLATKILQIELDADLNITMEQPYIDQLILGALSGLNKSVQDLVNDFRMDDARYGDIARKILDILVAGNVNLGSVTHEQTEVDFAPIKEQIKALFTEEKFSAVEIKYVMDIIFESFKTVGNLVNVSLAGSMKVAEAKLWGVTDLTDIGLKKLDTVLTDEVQGTPGTGQPMPPEATPEAEAVKAE